VSFLPTLSSAARHRLLFVILCLVWGTTWLALKAGINAVPPAFFSGVRWAFAGIVLLGWRRFRHQRVLVSPRLLGRVIVMSLVMVSLCAVIQLYGMRQVSSGLAAVINSALTPISMLGFAVAMGQERMTWRQGIAFAIGIVGVVVLFGPSAIAGQIGLAELLGAAGVALSAVLYCVASVMSRRVMRIIPPVQLTGLTNLIGGLALLALSLPLEPGAWQAAGMAWGWEAWLAWLWLVLAGSLGASIIYFLLVRDWGASRTASYAFVTPVISVFLGMVVFGEHVSGTEAIGMGLMLAGAALALRRAPKATDLTPTPPDATVRS
jgi:drug/metabolite transporter (DMT)-like permease